MFEGQPLSHLGDWTPNHRATQNREDVGASLLMIVSKKLEVCGQKLSNRTQILHGIQVQENRKVRELLLRGLVVV